MDFFEKETRRKMEEFNRLRPNAEQQRAIDEMRRIESDPINRIAHEQSRIAREALGQFFAREQHDYFVQQSRAIAEAIAPLFRNDVATQVASWITSPAWAQLHDEQTRVASQMVQTIAQIQKQIAPEIIESIRAISNFNDAPLRLAMETIGNLRLENESVVFQQFIAEALKQDKPLTKRNLAAITKSRLSKKKLSRLSKEQRERILFYLVLLMALVTIYSAIQAGRPVTINEVQWAQLQQPQITINNIWNLAPAEPVNYLVLDRGCTLRVKPATTADVVIKLAPGEIVQRVRPGHRWLFVRYKNQEGWVNKKYLEKVD